MGTNTGIGIGIGIPFKNNALGGDKPYLPPELKAKLIGVWDSYGKKNSDTDRNIIKNKIPNAGGDLEILNSAYRLNSGFGGYSNDFQEYTYSENVVVKDNTNAVFNAGGKLLIPYPYLTKDIPSFKIKVSGLSGTYHFRYYYRDSNGIQDSVDMAKDGNYELPICYNVQSSSDGTNCGFANNGSDIVTVEILPAFEGALVTDGINDIIASIKTLEEWNVGDKGITIISMIHQITTNKNFTTTNNLRVSKKLVGRNEIANIEKTGIYGWYKENIQSNTINVINNILGDKADYSAGASPSTNTAPINNSKFYVVGYVDSVAGVLEASSIAHYWTFALSGKATEDDINLIIAYYNLDRTLKPDILCNVKKQRITNENHAEFSDKLIDYSGNGRDIQLNNIAWNKESGIDDNGALRLDGVNDYGKVTGLPIYKDYTVVADREVVDGVYDNADGGIATKGNDGASGAFLFDYINQVFSFGEVTDFRIDPKRFISYQSKYMHNNTTIKAGNVTDKDFMCIAKMGDLDRYSKLALWSLLLFPYSMSEFLIERQLKKHKLGTLYPNMVEFRPIIKSNVLLDSKPTFVIRGTSTYLNAGDYVPENSKIWVSIKMNNIADRITKFTVNGKTIDIPEHAYSEVTLRYGLPFVIDKSPQKINITIDEYIRYEDIVQPYPVLLRFNDENGNEVSWGGKFKVGSTITRIGSIDDTENNLLNGLYSTNGLTLNGKAVTSSTSIVEKQMVFKTTATYLLDNNEPKSILSPSRLRIPNSSYKILGHIPDISGHGNHGVIYNSAYAEGSGVNEDGSYQFDGVDDFVTIPTTVGGKQVLMKVNWQSIAGTAILYDQRTNGGFAIFNRDYDTNENKVPAYRARNIGGNTYIDGILNEYIYASQLQNITHNIVELYDPELNIGTLNPKIGSSYLNSNYAQMSLYDFMLFDNISTEDKIKELNEYIGIEAKVELPPYYWDAYGKTNLDEYKATIQQRGVAEGDYDITNYNHAYDKMSGYGGYEFAKFDNVLDWYLTPNNNHIDVVSRNGYEITLRNLSTSVYGWYFQNSRVIGFITRDIPFKVKANKSIRVYWDMHSYKISSGEAFGHVVSITTLNPNEDTSISLRHLTEEELVELDTNKDRMYYLLWFDLSTFAVDEEVTIEMLPLYTNGLVYDGVEDYSVNTNIPALTDYTYIIKRENLNNNVNSATMYKGDKAGGGAFIVDYIASNGSQQYSYGNPTLLPLNENTIIYGTKTSYNGSALTVGSNTDENGLDIGHWSSNYKSIVLYKLILYPKTIPLLQINFLKNLMEKDEIIDLNNPIFIKDE